jgi:hypothetical protein
MFWTIVLEDFSICSGLGFMALEWHLFELGLTYRNKLLSAGVEASARFLRCWL